MDYWTTYATDPYFGFGLGEVEIVTHSPDKCVGRNCVVHNPSNHHMLHWPTVFRADKGVTERTCPHGIGHPDPDDAAYQKSIGRDALNVHGCDGCCIPLQ